MSFLTGNAQITNATPVALPASKKAVGVAVLQDHDFFLHCDPHLTSYKTESPPSSSDPTFESYKVPAEVAPLADDQKKVFLYEVTDHLPNPVWDSNVVSHEEFVNWAQGIWVRIRSPLGVVMETTWYVREREGAAAGSADGELELVEDVKITCNKMLMSVVKGSVETNWRGIHEKIIARIVEDSKK